jgi:hypothetical protein
VIRRSAVVGFLVLFWLGPLLAEAEAAEALALSIAEIAHPSVIEPTDPPAGADDLTAISLQADRRPVRAATHPDALPFPHPVQPLSPWNAPTCAAVHRPIEAPWPLVPGNARQASLQVFRF